MVPLKSRLTKYALTPLSLGCFQFGLEKECCVIMKDASPVSGYSAQEELHATASGASLASSEMRTC